MSNTKNINFTLKIRRYVTFKLFLNVRCIYIIYTIALSRRHFDDLQFKALIVSNIKNHKSYECTKEKNNNNNKITPAKELRSGKFALSNPDTCFSVNKLADCSIVVK